MTGTAMEHRVVAAAEGRFSGWPANNGMFHFEGDELLVGFTECNHCVTAKGHNVVGPTKDEPHPFKSLLARSLDGGDTWSIEQPGGSFVGQASSRCQVATFPGTAAFRSKPQFALRMVGTGYHGSSSPKGEFFATLDRGKTWSGPFAIGSLLKHPELEGMEITSRTCYHVETGVDGSLAALMSARPRHGKGLLIATDKTFLARTRDGIDWTFEGWLIPTSDPHRAVMPSLAVVREGHWVVALRRRDVTNCGTDCWIDVVVTHDAGRTWSKPVKVGATGRMNGNPPALVATRQGVLCCVYGERNSRRMLARYSSDVGGTWSDAAVLRDDYETSAGMADLGYPRVVQRESDGKLVAVYYWADAAIPRQYIAATIWDPPPPEA